MSTIIWEEHCPKSMGKNTWYITKQFVVLAITDEEVEKGNKIQMIQKLLSFEKPTSFSL